ncbi:nonaspanin tm9sf [Trichoderma arundinaceum]|uniref:Nonaspanin tm9sf n=1 Tax=Trichoderma arundinaceum TaxID=490622 RepID=A0A395NBP0_TRIAR|nr:nonaspanin tm9sf [Trichoderma arundinaceum]
MISTWKAGLNGLFYALLLSPSSAFYIPGWSIKSYKDGELIPLMVNKAYSDNTQLQYAFYDLPFTCSPTGNHKAGGGLLSGQSVPLNLGEVLRGDRIITSDMELAMAKDTPCTLLCNKEISRRDLRWSKELIRDGYVAEWIVDNLPGATSFVTADKSRKYYASGFKLGYTEASKRTGKLRYYLNNHHTIVIRYRKASGRAGDRGEKVIVGFEVYPKSVGNGNKKDSVGCPADIQNVDQPFELYIAPNRTSDASPKYDGLSYHPDEPEDDENSPGSLNIPYTYSVYFREDDSIEWAHRWDLYFVNQEEGSRIHWMAIINSLIICGLLTGIVMIILARTIHTDINKSISVEEGKFKTKRAAKSKGEQAPGLLSQGTDADNNDDEELSDEGEALEEATGWKLLHGDVFRKPRAGVLLAPLVGSGMQLFFMAMGLVSLGALGVLNPSFRGGFISVGVGLFIFAGLFSGYFSARVFKSFDGTDFRANALVTALLFPGLSFGLVFILNLFVWAQASSTAIPFGTLVAILLLWLCIQVPLVYAGSHYGFHKAGAWEHPTRTTTIPRQVPRQAWYSKSIQAVLLAGLIPFAVIFIELLFVFQSIWQDKSGYYYVFGFLAVVSAILVVTIAEVTIVSIYAQLCAENYHWWWQSFFVGGGSAFWVFLYSLWYYFFKLHITGFVSSMLFFAYSFMACCVIYSGVTEKIGYSVDSLKVDGYHLSRKFQIHQARFSSSQREVLQRLRAETEMAQPMDTQQFREAAKAAIDEIANYYDNVSDHRVVSAVEPGYLRPLLPASAPLDPEPWESIQSDIQSKILPGITHWQSPGFMAFFPCSSSYPAAIAEMYSNAFNGAHFNWICSPAVTELETVVMDWLAQALGLPECFLSGGPTHGGGVLHGSASEAILTVMVAARDKYLNEATAHLPEGEEKEEETWRLRSKLVALGSSGAHSSTKKAAQVLGVRFATVPVLEETGFSMTGEALTKTLEELKAKGLEPFYLTATLGSTDVCAVDDFQGITRTLAPRVGKPGEIWVHVDAAYAGAALLLDENKPLAKSLAEFHSFNFNPHKWMLTTFDCSAVWVRQRGHLINALSIKPPYLRNQYSDNELVTDYRDWQIPLGRRFRSLKLWFVLRSYGIRGLQAHIQKGVTLGESLQAKLETRPDLFTIFTKARFGLVVFRAKAEGEEKINSRTEKLYEAINASGQFYLTSTVVNGHFAIRVCTGVAAVQEEHVQKLFDLLVETIEAQLKQE